MDKILRLPETEACSGLGKTQIYEQIAAGHFPKPIPLTVGGRAVGWRESDIQAWLEQRAKAAEKVHEERKQQRQSKQSKIAA